MTYCVGILVRDGLAFIADTRTNAGIDNISTFRKLQVFEAPGERVIMVATAGNLAVTQGIMSLVTEGLTDPDGTVQTIWTTPSMFRTAQFIGAAVREIHRVDGPSLSADGAPFDVAMLVGGQIAGGRLRLFMIYRAGNFIEASEDTPYLQIGEHKYGKPILDRAVEFNTELPVALKLGLISMDSTMRSNLGVGMPIDVAAVRRDAITSDMQHRIEAGEPYFEALRASWSDALRSAHRAIPVPPYRSDGETTLPKEQVAFVADAKPAAAFSPAEPPASGGGVPAAMAPTVAFAPGGTAPAANDGGPATDDPRRQEAADTGPEGTGPAWGG